MQLHHQYHHLTPNMQRALAQLGKDLKYIDVRSGAALHRRGLARYEPGRMNNRYSATYYLTEAGADMLAEEVIRQQVRAFQIERKEWLKPDQHALVTAFATWLADR